MSSTRASVRSAWKHKGKRHPLINTAESDVPSTVQLYQAKEEHQVRKSHCWFTAWRHSAHLCCLFNFQEEGVKVLWLSSQHLHFLWSSNLETGFGGPGLQLLHLLLKMCNLQSQEEERAATANTAGSGTNVSALGSCLNYTTNSGHFAAKAGNSSWTLTGKNTPIFSTQRLNRTHR